MHATNAWKKDKELYARACRILKHLWFDVKAEGEEYETEDRWTEDGRDRASANEFSTPGRWMMLLVSLLMKESCLCWLADHGGVVLNKACDKGLWSENKIKSLPSRRRQPRAQGRRRNSGSQCQTAFWSRRRGGNRTVAQIAEVLLQPVYMRHLQLKR